MNGTLFQKKATLKTKRMNSIIVMKSKSEKQNKSNQQKIQKNRFINMGTIRRKDQRDVMQEIEKQGHCPFCRENLDKYHKNPILKEGKYWLLTENQWPYEHVKHQLL